MNFIQEIIREADERRTADAERFATLDHDICMLCHAAGADKRSLWIGCGYAVHEVVPEAIDTFSVASVLEGTRGMYYLLICKNCRGELLGLLRAWRDHAVDRRRLAKDHDGHLDEDADATRTIPVRENGRIVMMSEQEYATRDRPDSVPVRAPEGTEPA